LCTNSANSASRDREQKREEEHEHTGEVGEGKSSILDGNNDRISELL
jgi:hypothetical protein